MSELIKREDAINAVAELQGRAQSKAELTGISKAWKRIKALPTVDAVPVCHAYWYWDKDGMDWNIGAWRCSACHNRPNTIWETEKNLRPRRWSGSAYCSNCGAVMDGKEKENESND